MKTISRLNTARKRVSERRYINKNINKEMQRLKKGGNNKKAKNSEIISRHSTHLIRIPERKERKKHKKYLMY